MGENCGNKIVARAAVAPQAALPALGVAACFSAALLGAAVMPLLTPKDKLVEVLNLSAWAVVLLGLCLPGGLWTLAHTPLGPRTPPAWGERLMQVSLAHYAALALYVLSVLLHVGYGLLGPGVLMVTGLVLTFTAAAMTLSVWPATQKRRELLVILPTLLLALLLHGVMLARFGPQWRASSLEVGGWVISPVVVSHLLLTAGVLAAIQPVEIKKWNAWAVWLGGVTLAVLFVLNSSLPDLKGKTGWLKGFHPIGAVVAGLIMHRYFPRLVRREAQPPRYQTPARVFRYLAFLWLAASVVLAFKTMSGDWASYPLMRQAHFHANTLGFLTLWLFAHMADELEALLASDNTVYLVLDSQTPYLWAAGVFTLLGALGLTGAFLLPGKPHAVSALGGVCTMLGSLLWLRLFLMGRVMVKRQMVSTPAP